LLVDHASILADTVGDVDGAGIGIDITVTEAIRLTQGGTISTASSGAGKAGDVRITAGSVQMAGVGTIIGAEAFDRGRAGDIVMHVGTLTLAAGALISSTTTGTGQGGDVVVTATQGMTLAGAANTDNLLDSAQLLAGTSGRGNAGRVAITTPTLTLEGFASINASTFNEGNAGSVEITADRVSVLEGGSIFSDTRGTGQGGTVSIAARESLSLQNGGRLSTSAFDQGNAGRVSITTPNLVMQGGFIEAQADSTGGNAGTIVVDADRMTLTAGAAIDSDTRGAGRGGSVSLRGGSLVMGGAFINTTTRGDMAGGSIDIHLTDALDMRNAGAILAATFGAGRGGDITVGVGNLTLTGGAEINGTTRGPGPGGDITVTAHNSLSIFGRSSVPSLSLSGLVTNAFEDGPAGRIVVATPTLQMDDGVIQAMTLGKGRAGEIQINVGSLTLTGGALISSSSGATSLATEVLPSATGQGGNVVITATDFVTISGRGDGFPSSVLTETSGSGNAGHITLSTPILTMDDGRISSATAGDGRAGDVMLHVGRLTLAGGAQIASASGSEAGAVGSGQGGGVTITADDTIAISGRLSTIASTTFGSGDAGNISLTASTLRMDNEGTIKAGGAGGRAGDIRIGAANIILTGGAAIATSTTGAGPGGNVIVTAADLLSISGQDADGVGSGIASGTLGSGVGGNIVLQAQRLELNNGGLISVLSLGAGDAGNIVLQAGKTFRSRHGVVSAEAEKADGGNIQLTVGSRVELRNSQITATVGTGVGKGGNITIDPQFVVMQGSQVRADAFGGPGGNVRIVAGVFLADPPSRVSASSALNIPGTVDIQAPVTNISGAIAPLPQEFASTAELLRDRCAGRLREGRMSRLVLGGRDGVPSEPSSLLLSPLIQMGSRENEAQAGIPAKPGQVQERAWHVQVGVLEGLDIECTRWTGHRGTTVKSKTYP
jgi:large exoprotein involved in heme utilization and adhesion